MELSEVALGVQLDAALGEAEAKKVLEDIALVLAKHRLVQSPEVCKMLFAYMIFVTEGWNSV